MRRWIWILALAAAVVTAGHAQVFRQLPADGKLGELTGQQQPYPLLQIDSAVLRLDIRAVRDRKLAAIASHRSQLLCGDPLSLLRPGLVERLLDEEWYDVAHGPDLPPGATDPFAGL